MIRAMLSYPDLGRDELGSNHLSIDLKKLMGWLFVISVITYGVMSVRSFPGILHRDYAIPFFVRPLLLPEFSIAIAVISGLAAWTVLRRRPSAQSWAIAACLAHILVFFRPFILHLRTPWFYYAGALVFGLYGLVIFLQPDRREPVIRDS
jgi:hypothetical protein